MFIIPSITAENYSKCQTVTRVLRGFVSVIGVRVPVENKNVIQILSLFNRQPVEIELYIPQKNYDEILQKIITAHNDVNIGKVFFYTDDEVNVEKLATDVRIFGINPGIIIDKNNYKKLAVVNKFDYGIINIHDNPDYKDIYKYLKENDFRGSLFLDFGEKALSQEILTDMSIDGIYTDVTMNPMIKDTISSYRRLANSVYN